VAALLVLLAGAVAVAARAEKGLRSSAALDGRGWQQPRTEDTQPIEPMPLGRGQVAPESLETAIVKGVLHFWKTKRYEFEYWRSLVWTLERPGTAPGGTGEPRTLAGVVDSLALPDNLRRVALQRLDEAQPGKITINPLSEKRDPASSTPHGETPPTPDSSAIQLARRIGNLANHTVNRPDAHDHGTPPTCRGKVMAGLPDGRATRWPGYQGLHRRP
jgi:hypothetical protein